MRLRMRLSRCAPGDPGATIAYMSEQPQMNRNPEFLARKRRRVHDPHVRPLNTLVDRWNGDRLRVPYADPDSGGIHARILFLHESPGPRASAEHGSGLVSTDNNDPSAERFCITVAVFRSVTALQLSVARGSRAVVTYCHLLSVVVGQVARAWRRAA